MVKVGKLQCKTVGHAPCLFQFGVGKGIWEHSLVKVGKLQCIFTGHCHCLFLWGFQNTVWLRLQS